MKSAKNVGKLLWAVTLLLTLTALGFSAVSHQDIVRIKGKINAGQVLTQEDLLLAKEINATTGSYINLNQALGRSRLDSQAERGRGRGSLDEYEWETVPYEWVDISTDGTNTGLSWDDENLGPFDLGFSFTYFDTDYTSMRICSNGWISPTSNWATYWNTDIPSAEEPNNVIYGLWDDLYLPTGGQVLYYADAANQRFIVSWLDVPHIDGTSGPYTFQIILHADGGIIINYNSVNVVTSSTVGIENSDGTVGLQIYSNGVGEAPANETAFQISEGEQIFVPVSGTVAFDGGNGVMTQVTVRASGQGAPNVHPAANGNYSIPNVQIGNRTITASLNGYTSQSQFIAVAQPGNTGVNFTLRRNPPPAPTSLTATVNSGTGVVDLDWVTSPDPLVDNYRVYRKLSGDTGYVLMQTFVPSNGTDQLTAPGIYDYVVTAVDVGASTPVESGRSARATVLYGELPPSGLSANGNFDNKIRLNWLEPGSHPALQIFYDDSTSEAWYHVTFPNAEHDYFAVRFTPPAEDSIAYPLALQEVNVFLETSDPIPNFWITPDLNGAPDLENPYRNWTDIAADGSPGWVHGMVNGEVFLETPDDFWVVMQFPPGVNGAPGCGSDQNQPEGRSYWTWDNTQGIWNQWFSHDWMMRVWVGGPRGEGFVLSSGTPSGYRADALPQGTTAPSYFNSETGEISQQVGPTRPIAQSRDDKNKWSELFYSSPSLNAGEVPFVLAPALEFESRERGRGSLDEVIHYNVYKNGVEIAEPIPTNYEDFAVVEGTVYSYYVTATYDNLVESGQTGTVNRAANMAPAAPGNIAGVTLNSTTIRISWTDPTLNANGTPCVDLAALRVYRDNTLIGTVAPGVLHFDDVPPQPNVQYEWKVRAIDEVPNEGPIASFAGSVVNPWQEETVEWEDITGTGTPILLCFWCIEGPFDLGFDFTYYGNTYNEVYICSNGYLTFSAGQFASGNGPQIPDPSNPNNIVAALWTGFNTFSGNCRYLADDTNDRFIISWDECPDFNGFGIYTFQIILESNGRITFQYVTVPNSSFLQVGMENEAGSLGISLWSNSAGDFEPASETAVSFFGPAPVYVPVSGTVTLDGGAGNITQVAVAANGVNHPVTNPLANGTYSMPEVVAGNRRFIATLPNYISDTNRVAVPEGGLINNNFTLRRVNPPTPTNLTGTVNSGTGVVTLNWDNSTDPLVDVYRIYRRLQGDQNWLLVTTVVPSNGTHQLTADGVYQFTVTAVDNDVSTPAESNRSNSIEVLYGEIPPTNLVANGNFDDHIRLTWLSPGSHPAYYLFYDDSSSEAWFHVTFPNTEHDYFAVRFTPPSEDSASYPLQIQTVNVFMETSDPIPNVWITHDVNGAPDINNPIRNWTDIGADGNPGWINAEANGEQLLESPDDFWVVMQFPPGVNGAPGVGSDQSAPDGRSYWTWDGTPGMWNQWFSHDWMMRVWLGGPHGEGFVLSSGTPSGYQVNRVPSLAINQNVSEKQKTASAEMIQKNAGPVRVSDKQSKVVSVTSQTLSNYNPFVHSGLMPYVQAPALEYNDRGSSERGRGSLDEILYYIVYHNGTDVGHPTETNYNYPVPAENVDHTFYVKAHYDNNEDSGPSNTVVEQANMAPGTPTNVALQPQGQNSMRITWTDPTLNADGTPCVDLAGLRIYRDDTFLSNVGLGVQQYVDTPPDNQTRYTWSVRGVDEVPNIGPAGSQNGAVVSPWEVTDYEWVNITGTGTSVTLCDDCSEGPFALGFTFNYYGQDYTQVRICSNGWITFSDYQWGDLWAPQIPDPQEPNALVALSFQDLLPTGGECRYYADTQNQRFIVSWDNCPHFGSGEIYDFQMILDESGSITMNYQTIPLTNFQIGVENQDGTSGEGLWNSGVGDFTPTNNSAVVFWGGPAGELAGTVRVHSTNALLADVRVWATGWADTVLTDAQGNFFMELDPATYTVHFEKAGYCDTVFTNILVEDGNTTVRNARMLAPTAGFSLTSINESSWPNHDIVIPFNITNPTGNCPLDFNIVDPVNWLTSNPSTGSVNPGQTVQVNVTILGSLLGPGEHQSQLTIHNGSLNTPYVIPVTLFMAVSADDPSTPLPTEFALHQNYPNPFNATTAIRFDLPKDSRVSLKIFNLMGQEVATALNDNLPAGRHEISYTASDLPSGMYMIRMEAENFNALNKMVLLK